jgi:hypothetical protein
VGGTIDHPGERVIKDGIGHGTEGASVVDRADVRVELAIELGVWACDPNYAQRKWAVSINAGEAILGKDELLCCGVSFVVLPTWLQSGQ